MTSLSPLFAVPVAHGELVGRDRELALIDDAFEHIAARGTAAALQRLLRPLSPAIDALPERWGEALSVALGRDGRESRLPRPVPGALRRPRQRVPGRAAVTATATSEMTFTARRLSVAVSDVRGFQRSYELAVPDAPDEETAALVRRGAP